jgi:hypothetical protein
MEELRATRYRSDHQVAGAELGKSSAQPSFMAL